VAKEGLVGCSTVGTVGREHLGVCKVGREGLLGLSIYLSRSLSWRNHDVLSVQFGTEIEIIDQSASRSRRDNRWRVVLGQLNSGARKPIAGRSNLGSANSVCSIAIHLWNSKLEIVNSNCWSGSNLNWIALEGLGSGGIEDEVHSSNTVSSNHLPSNVYCGTNFPSSKKSGESIGSSTRRCLGRVISPWLRNPQNRVFRTANIKSG